MFKKNTYATTILAALCGIDPPLPPGWTVRWARDDMRVRVEDAIGLTRDGFDGGIVIWTWPNDKHVSLEIGGDGPVPERFTYFALPSKPTPEQAIACTRRLMAAVDAAVAAGVGCGNPKRRAAWLGDHLRPLGVVANLYREAEANEATRSVLQEPRAETGEERIARRIALARCWVGLLEDAHPGLSTWNGAVDNAEDRIRQELHITDAYRYHPEDRGSAVNAMFDRWKKEDEEDPNDTEQAPASLTTAQDLVRLDQQQRLSLAGRRVRVVRAVVFEGEATAVLDQIANSLPVGRHNKGVPAAWGSNGPQPPRSIVISVYQGEMELVLGPACPDQGAASPSGSFESGESDGPEVCLCGWLREDHGRPVVSYGDARWTTDHAWARGMIVGARGAMLDVLRWIEGTETQEAVGPLEQIRGRIQGHLDDMAAAGVLDPDGDKK